MGTSKMIKSYAIISGLALNDNNRGTAALGYGAFSFLQQKGLLKDNMRLIKIVSRGNPFKKGLKRTSSVERIFINNKVWVLETHAINPFVWKFFRLTNIALPFSHLRFLIKRVSFVAALNGGDGFSDIYNTQTFYSRLYDTEIAMRAKIPLVQLPQTFGPFNDSNNFKLAQKILRYSTKIYVRDKEFVSELEKMGLAYELTKDLSAYMQPEPWDINIIPNSIGINVSGLCYSNKFRTLSGQFEQYPELIDRLIHYFLSKGKTVYLIPHSYHYGNPEENNDDMVACRMAYDQLVDKSHVVFVDKNLRSPQVKYVISKMSFFIGTRMHANFAAIYSGVPLFGLAYSYKFAGAFNANGLDGDRQTHMINNINSEEIDRIISKIGAYYFTTIKH